jgi:hypothetical protein
LINARNEVADVPGYKHTQRGNEPVEYHGDVGDTDCLNFKVLLLIAFSSSHDGESHLINFLTTGGVKQ